jgi:hypothetical protein
VIVQSAGKIASSIESIARTKHIEVAHLGIQQEVAKERIEAHYVNTENQAANLFTKSLARPLFGKLKKTLGLISSKEMRSNIMNSKRSIIYIREVGTFFMRSSYPETTR